MKYLIVLMCLCLMNYSSELESVPFNQTGLFEAIEITRGVLVSLYDTFKLTNAEQCLINFLKLEDIISDFIQLIHNKTLNPVKYIADFVDFFMYLWINKCADLIKIFPHLAIEIAYIVANPLKYGMAVLAHLVEEGFHFF